MIAPLAVTACGGDSSGPSTVTLPLTSIDSKALPTTLPAGSGTVVILDGRLVGNSAGPACTYYLQRQGFSDPDISGAISPCAVNAGDVQLLQIDLGGGQSTPSGTHTYRFGQ